MLNKQLVKDILQAATSTGGDFAEVYIENKYNTGLGMLGGKLERIMTGRDFGVGIRIFNGTNSVYAYSNDVSPSALIKVAKEAAMTISGVPKDMNLSLVSKSIDELHRIEKNPIDIPVSQKIDLMRKGYSAAVGYDASINQVNINYLDYKKDIIVANTEGLWAEDTRIRTRYYVTSIAEHNGVMQTGSASKGASMGFELFDKYDVETIAKEAARIAVTMSKAGYAPSGKMPVVLDNAFGGVIFHEACGHGLEATAIAKGTSVYNGKLGEQIASSVVNAVDDGTIPNGWGSSNISDEGEDVTRNSLIENGVLKGYMIDKLGGIRMGMPSTGAGRRESYKFAPTSRMTNTFILGGEDRFEDMISSIDNGLYAKTLGGGSVNTSTGEFNFNVQEGYMVSNGVIGEPVRGATLIGTGLEVLKRIEMISDNFESGEGMCGSISGSIPAGLGQPALKVSELIVGGREE